MDNSTELILQFLILILIIASGLLGYFFYIYLQENRILRAGLSRLNESFQELDEQAKLIVKTDLELNKTQEELDKRLNGLDALQKISRSISTTLDENEVFLRLKDSVLSELGFEKFLILSITENAQLAVKLALGYAAAEQNRIKDSLAQSQDLITLLKDGGMVASLQSPPELQNRILEMAGLRHFVMMPVLIQGQMTGFILAGNPGDAFAMTEGDTELISILADQIGQSLQNARLFEQAYRAQQELEAKVQERTKQLSLALKEVQEISRNKSEFISAVSHELRTPLTSIKGYAALLIAGQIGDIPDKVKERLERINKHSDNLVKLINDLLDIAKIEAGKIEMKVAPHPVGPLVENVHDLLTPQIKEKNITFTKEIPPGFPPVPTNLGHIERVFINLVNNAIKFTPPGGTIKVSASFDNDKATFTVADSGIGIKPDDLPRLFNEFYRIDNEINQNVKGTGLGLALCKKIIEAHKGRIWVESTPGQGATFCFTLPR